MKSLVASVFGCILLRGRGDLLPAALPSRALSETSGEYQPDDDLPGLNFQASCGDNGNIDRLDAWGCAVLPHHFL